MKCRACGTENGSNVTYCKNCGARLTGVGSVNDFDMFDEDSDIIDDTGVFDDASISDLEKRFMNGVESWEATTDVGKKPGAAQPRASSRGGERSSANENYEPRTQQAQSPRGEQRANNTQKQTTGQRTQNSQSAQRQAGSGSRARANYETRRAQPIKAGSRPQKPDREEGVSEADGKAEAKRKRSIISIFLAVIALLVVVLVFAIVFPSSKPSGSKYAATIVPSSDKEGFYCLTVNADVGDKVVVRSSADVTSELEVSSKKSVTFDIPVSDLLPVAPISTPTYDVVPTVGIIKKGETEAFKVDVPSVTITVPQFAIVFDHELELEEMLNSTPDPDDTTPKQHVIDVDTIECVEGRITISGKVPISDITVKFDGEETELIGMSFSYSTKFETKGNHSIEFEATLPGYLTVRRTFTAIVAEDLTAQQVVYISDSFYTRVSNEKEEITVVGTVPVGAKLSITSNDPEFSLKEAPTVDDKGNFSFTVNLPIAGKNYEMNIEATLKSGNVIVRPFAVQRPPIFNDYVPTVWACNYSDMSKPIYFGTKGFVISGYITEMMDSSDYQYAKLQLSDNHIIHLKYYNHYAGSSTLEAGKNYTMYGYPIGFDGDGVLEVFIWFVRA